MLRVFGTHHVRVSVVQQPEVVVTGVREVPVGAGILRHPDTPRLVAGAALGEVGGKRAVLGGIGEGEALTGEPHRRAPGVLQRTAVGSYAVVMTHPGIDTERQGSARGRTGHVGHIRAILGDPAGQQLGRQRRIPERLGQPQHRCLLGDLAARTGHRQRRTTLTGVQELLHFFADVIEEGLITGVVEIGEHEVLEDQQTEFVAQIEECWGLVGGDSGNAHHIGPGRRQSLQQGSVGLAITTQPEQIGAGPHRAPAEDRHAVELQPEVVSVGDLQVSKAGARQPVHATVGQHQLDVIQRR